jgi:UDP-N-acetyl-D-galactosamine dehydrogenase
MLNNGIDVARARVAVLGVTFKDNCPDIRNSKVVDLIDELQNWSIETLVIDPWASAAEVREHYSHCTARSGGRLAGRCGGGGRGS